MLTYDIRGDLKLKFRLNPPEVAARETWSVSRHLKVSSKLSLEASNDASQNILSLSYFLNLKACCKIDAAVRANKQSKHNYAMCQAECRLTAYCQ